MAFKEDLDVPDKRSKDGDGGGEEQEEKEESEKSGCTLIRIRTHP